MSTESDTTTTVLSAEVLAVMDRAVRSARENGWCYEFSKIAADVFGVQANEVLDSDGLNCQGYDHEGFNSKGVNRDGYNREGFDYDGYDKNGFNKDGFNLRGFNVEGFDKDGRDKYKYDRNGYDQEGYDSYGDRRRTGRAWYTEQTAKPETDFRYDGDHRERPTTKKTIKERIFGES